MQFNFLSRPVVEHLHKRQIEKFGGSYGLRDEGALESALMRPLNKVAYGCNDLIELAAAYLFGLAMNHAFIDGNKRTGILAAVTFLALNDVALEFEEAMIVTMVIGLAAGEVSEDELADWLRRASIQ